MEILEISCFTSLDPLTHLLECPQPTWKPLTTDIGSQQRTLQEISEQERKKGCCFFVVFLFLRSLNQANASITATTLTFTYPFTIFKCFLMCVILFALSKRNEVAQNRRFIRENFDCLTKRSLYLITKAMLPYHLYQITEGIFTVQNLLDDSLSYPW